MKDISTTILKRARWAFVPALVFALLGCIYVASIVHADTAAPVINTVAPSTVSVTGGDTVTLSGSNFVQGSIVRVNTTFAATTYVDGSTLTFTTPSWPIADTANISVDNPDGQTATLSKALVYLAAAPTIASITPNHGPLRGGQDISISGNNLAPSPQPINSVSTGSAFGCGIYGGKTYCWGGNTGGQLGIGSANSIALNPPTPIVVSGSMVGKTPVSISVYANTACELMSDGTVYCWGANIYGQLGNGTTTTSNTPVAVTMPSGASFKSVSVGGTTVCGLTTTGLVYCWGDNNNGQLGIGNTTTKTATSPTKISMTGVLVGKTLTSVSVGNAHACVVASDSQVYCWGYNSTSQLGNGSSATSSAPIAVTNTGVLAGKTIASVEAGASSTCALDTNGVVYCWGLNSGRLGNGSTTNSNVPVQVVSGETGGKKFLSISVGDQQACGLAADYQVYCWGPNNGYQVGNGTNTITSSPVAVNKNINQLAANENFQSIDTGSTSSCAISSEDQLYCWGANPTTGTATNFATAPKQFSDIVTGQFQVLIDGSAATNVQSVSSTSLKATTIAHTAGTASINAITPDAQSSNASTYTYQSIPIATSIAPTSVSAHGGDIVTLTGDNFTPNTKVYVGVQQVTPTFINASTLTFAAPSQNSAISKVVSVVDEYNQRATYSSLNYILDAPSISSVSPSYGPSSGGNTVTITGSSFLNAGNNVRQVAIANGTICSQSADFAVYCIGALYTNGQTSSTTQYNKLSMNGPLAGKYFTNITGSASHFCAISNDKLVYCWGNGTSGQIGNGGTLSTASPTAPITTGVLNNKTINVIANSNGSSCVIASDAKPYCWGLGTTGQLGNNLSTNSTQPVAVTTTGVLSGKTLTKIAATNQSMCAVSTDDNVYCWGYNSDGQLGNGTKTTSPVPVQVNSTNTFANKKITSISGGISQFCVSTDDSNIYCWGNNSSSQLGDGTTTAQTTPVKVVFDSSTAQKGVLQVALTSSTSCALMADYTVYCWGSNSNGLAGNGSTTPSTLKVPTPIDMSGTLTGHSVASIVGGSNNFCVISEQDEQSCWGYNAYGQLADGTTTSSTSPIKGAMPTINPIVTFDQSAATVQSSTNNNSLQVTIPAHAYGKVAVSVTNYDGQKSALADSYNYIAPATAGYISPSSGLISGGDSVTLTGTNFTDGMQIKIGGIDVGTVTVINDTTATFIVPAGTVAGSVNIDLTDSYGQTTTIVNGYAYMLPAPTISTITPSVGTQDGGTTVTIKGSGFVSKTTGSWYSVTIGGTAATSVSYVDANTLTFVTPAHATGLVDVVISGQYVSSSVTASNTYNFLPSKYVFSNTGLSLNTNEAGKLTIVAENKSGTPVSTTTDVTLSLTSSSTSGQFARSLTEDLATRWTYNTVTIPAGQSYVDVYYRDTTSGTPTVTATLPNGVAISQVQTIASQYKLQVTGVTSPIQAGVPSSVTVRTVDKNGNPITGYTGTVLFTSNDAAAVLPPAASFADATSGIRTFTNGVTMGTRGTYCVTATDTNDPGITGKQCGISVAAPNTGSISQLKFITPVQRVASGSYSAPITIQTQGSDGSALAVASATTVYLYSNSATGMYSQDGTTWSTDEPYAATIPTGASSLNVYYKDAASRTNTIVARDRTSDTSDGTSGDFGWTNATQSITTGVSPATTIKVSGPQVLVKGQKYDYTVEQDDDAGTAVTASHDVTIRIASSSATGSFYDEGATVATSMQPYEITIPSGETTAHFSYSDTTITTGQNLTDLTFTDGRTATATDRLKDQKLSVQVVDALPTKVLLSPSSQSAVAGEPVAVTVGLADTTNTLVQATGATTVRLTSSSTGKYSLTSSPFTPISSITFNQGDTSKQLFYRSTLAASDTLTGAASGLSSASASVSVSSDAPTKIATETQSLTTPINTNSSSVTFTLYDQYGNIAKAMTDTAVYLYSSVGSTHFYDKDGNEIDHVTVAQGNSNGSFYLRDTAFSDTDPLITISDAAPLDIPDTGSTNATFTTHTTGQPITSIEFATQPQQTNVGQTSSPISVQLKNADGSPAIQDGTSHIQLSADGGVIVDNGGNTISNVTIEKGATSATFWYTSNTAGTFNLTVKSGAISVTQPITVMAGAMSSMRIDTPSRTVAPGTLSQPVHVSFFDEYGNITVTNQSDVLALSSSCADQKFYATNTATNQITNLTIPQGDSGATFYVTGATPGDCLVTVSKQAVTSVSQGIHITSYTTESSIITSDAQTVIAGKKSAAIHIQLLKADGTPALQDGTTFIALAAPEGTFYASQTAPATITQVPIAAGSASVDVYYSATKAGVYQLTASLGTISTNQNITVSPAEATQLQFTSNEQSVNAGSPSGSFAISLLDTYANTTTASTETELTLTTTCGGASFSLDAINWTPTSTLKIPVQNSTGHFYMKSNIASTCQVTVSGSNVGSATQAITINSTAYPKSLVISTQTGVHVKGDQISVTISVHDQNGNPIAVTTQTHIALSDETNGSVGFSTVDLQPGQTQASTYYTPRSSGTKTIRAVESSNGLEPASTEVAVIEGAATGYTLTTAGSTKAGQAQKLTLKAVNKNNIGVAAINDSSFSLSSTGDGYFVEHESDGTEASIHTFILKAGQQSAELYYAQTQSGTLTIRMTADDGLNASLPITFIPADAYAIHIINDAYTGAQSLRVGETAHYRVQLFDEFGNITPTDTAMVLQVSSTGNGTISGNGSVQIPAGQSTGTFSYIQSTLGDYTVNVSDSGNVLQSAAQQGSYAEAGPQEIHFTTSPATLERGGVSNSIRLSLTNAQGSLQTAGSQGQDIVLAAEQNGGLVSSSPSNAFAQTVTVHIPAGATGITVYYRNDTAQIDERTCTTTACTITQTYPYSISASTSLYDTTVTDTKNINVIYGAPTKLVITSTKQSIQANTPSSAYIVQQQNAYGKAVPVDTPQQFYLNSSNAATGVFADTKTNWGITSVTMQPGNSTASFYYEDEKVSSPTITVADTLPINPDVMITNAVQTVTVTKQTQLRSLKSFLVTNISDPQNAGTPSSTVVAALDSNGFVLDTYKGTVTFSSNDTTAKLPAQYTYTASDKGVHTFANAVAFKTPGQKDVIVEDVQAQVQGAQQDITVLGRNTSPVSAVAFLGQRTYQIAPNTSSQALYLELKDAQGNPTTAPAGGYDLRLTSSSGHGEFSTDQKNWTSQLIVSVPESFAITSLYYRSAVTGQDTVTVTDWQSGSDAATVSNDDVNFDIDTLYLTATSSYLSKNVFGTYTANPILFSSQPDGLIQAQVKNSYQSFLLSNNLPQQSLWRTEWRQGVDLLEAQDYQNTTTTVTNDIDTITTHVGAEPFYSTAKATASSFDDPYSVVSLQNKVAVSPWRSVITITGKSFDGSLVITPTFYNGATQASPSVVSYGLVPETATSDDTVEQNWASAAPQSSAATSLPLMHASQNKLYRIIATTYDANGAITSESISDTFDPSLLPVVENSETAASTTTNIPQSSADAAQQTQYYTSNDVDTEGNAVAQIKPVAGAIRAGSITPATMKKVAFTKSFAAIATTLLVIVLLLESIKEVLRTRQLIRFSKSKQFMSHLTAPQYHEVVEGEKLGVFFWVPIILSVVYSTAAFFTLHVLGDTVSQHIGVIVTLVVVIALFTAIYLALRLRYLRNESKFIQQASST